MYGCMKLYKQPTTTGHGPSDYRLYRFSRLIRRLPCRFAAPKCETNAVRQDETPPHASRDISIKGYYYAKDNATRDASQRVVDYGNQLFSLIAGRPDPHWK